MSQTPVNFPTLSKPAKKIILILTGAVTFIILVLAVRGDLPRFRAGLNNLPLFATLIRQRDQVAASAKVENLNYYIPSFDYLAAFIAHPGVFDPNRLRGYNSYIDYYEKVVETFPQLADGYGLLAFFYAQEGDIKKAMTYYDRASNLNPDFFWFHYDLGILALRLGNYPLALTAFQRALKSNPEFTLKVIYSSTTYRQILASNEKYAPQVVENLKQAYAETNHLLQLSEQLTQSPGGKMDPSLLKTLQLRIF